MKKLSECNFLLVEDDENLREILYEFLVTKVANLYSTSNGEEAIQVVLLEDIDFILSDIKMPILDGVEFLKKMDNSEIKMPSILFMSGESNYTAVDVCKLGAKGLLNKPFLLDGLHQKINSIIDEG